MTEIDYDEQLKRIKDIYASCTPTEQNMLKTIVQEISLKGYSETLETVWLADFKEIPVSIDRFLRDPYFLGKTNDNGNMIYPGWWPVYHDIFDGEKDIFEICLSGATRIGKSSTAVSGMAYMTYLLMCYKNPQKYFHLKDISRITIAFANLTLDLASGVAFHEYMTTLKESPWFNDHGRFSKSIGNPIYAPEGEKIDIIPSSDSAHLLGLQLWACVVGNTQIITDKGIFRVDELANLRINILQYDYNKSDYCYANASICLTKYVKQTIRLELEDGTIFEGTPDHKVMISDGTYKRLDELTEDDDVLCL